MMVVNKRNKMISGNSTARLLVLGDKQVGKSASIVRFTTGRYIQDYCGSTNDWLYRHPLGFEPRRNVSNVVELLEQKDIQFCNLMSLDSDQQESVKASNSNQQSLASRVALDQQIDNELYEKQQLLNKLHWANAYIVIYAINDINTFNKAIKYLNLIDNNVNSQHQHQYQYQHQQQQQQQSNNSGGKNGAKLLNLLSPSQQGSFNCTAPSANNSPYSSTNCTCLSSSTSPARSMINNSTVANSLNHLKRPVLLLGNKRDLEKNGRQVPLNDGRLLAIRHQTMFAEISIAESSKPIENILLELIEQISPADLHISQQQQSTTAALQNTQLIQWKPLQAVELATIAPVWASLVKSKPIGSTIVQSSRLIASARPQEADVRLLTPLSSCSLVASSRPLESQTVRQSCSPLRPLLLATTSCGATLAEVAKVQPVTYGAAKPLVASQIIVDQKPSAYNKSSNGRYENFKSSFKKASMAIVSSRTLAKCAHRSPPGALFASGGHKSSTEMDPRELVSCYSNNASDSDTSSVSKTMSLSDRSSNWLKSHIRLGGHMTTTSQNLAVGNSSDTKLNNNNNASQPSSIDRFRRPLFKYKSRRKTVAFDQMAATSASNDEFAPVADPLASSQTDTESIASQSLGKLVDVKRPRAVAPTSTMSNYTTPALATSTTATTTTTSGISNNYNPARCSSGRSSSSLSTTDTYYSSLFLVCRHDQQSADRAPSSAGSMSICSSTNTSSSGTTHKALGQQVTASNNSRSTLSRASTSGGSYEDTSGDELLTLSGAQPVAIGPSTTRHLPLLSSVSGVGAFTNKPNSKRQQLVKTVQSTLTNLTKSSNSTAQVAKKSFCNALFKYSTPCEAKTMITNNQNLVSGELATIEQIHGIPIIGYCK